MRWHPMQWISGLLVGLSAIVALLSAGVPVGRDTPQETLVVGLEAEPASLDPHVTTALSDFRVLANVHEGLVRFARGSLEVEPALAERWTVSGDGRRYTFQLRRGTTFHDGTPFDAAAVAFNLERMLRKDHPHHDTGPFPLAFFLEAIRRIETPSADVVELVLDEPFAPLLANLAYPVGFMLSPEGIRRHGKEVGRHPSGTGPFRFVEWRSHHRIVLERHDGYWGERARSERVIFRPVAEAMTRVAELRRGGLDLVAELPADNVAWFRRAPGFRVHETLGPHLWFVILNTRVPPFSDRRLRLAVNHAVDVRAIVSGVLQGTAIPASGPVPEAFSWAHDPDVRPYPHDPDRARALLKSAGYGDGLEVTFHVPQGGSGMLAPVEMATAIQADLAAVGIRVRIESYEWNTYLARVNAGLSDDAHMAAMAWMTNDPDTLPYLGLRSGAVPPSGFNSGYYENRVVDGLIERARREMDRNTRASLYRRIQRLVHDDAPWIFVGSWKQSAVATERLHGFHLEPSFFLRLSEAFKR